MVATISKRHVVKMLSTLHPFYGNTEKPRFDVKLTLKLSITVKERFSVRVFCFEDGRKFFDGTTDRKPFRIKEQAFIVS